MGETVTVIDQVTGVFSSIGSWISESLPKIVTIFYDSTSGLTFLGTLAVCGLAVSVFFLLMNIVQNFLHFRG